jgi:dihydrofolate reductase
MSTVVFDISMSLDGFITADDRTPAEPLGDGGERLHQWAFGDDAANRAYLNDAIDGLGAVVCGRVTYDDSLPFWGADGPSGPARRPVFVVTHRAPTDAPADGVYQFVTDGIEAALQRAKDTAGDKDVTIMGGASIGQQYIAAGLVDDLSVHLVPVLFHRGTRMFEHLDGRHVNLELISTHESPTAIHVRFRIIRSDDGLSEKVPSSPSSLRG